MHLKRVEKETTNRFTYPLSARDAKYIRIQEQKAKKIMKHADKNYNTLCDKFSYHKTTALTRGNKKVRFSVVGSRM